MIDSIGSNMSLRPASPQNSRNATLNSSQKSLIEETLSNYDANNLSQ